MMQAPTKHFSRQTGTLKRPAFCVVMAALSSLLSTPVRAGIDNTVTVSGTYNAAPVTSPPASVSVPVTPQNSNLVVTKTANDTTDVVAGQTVTYTYTITNSGNVTLSAVSLGDVHNGSGPDPVPGGGSVTNDAAPLNNSTDANPADSVWDTLAPGDTVTFTATYTVTQDDVDTKQ